MPTEGKKVRIKVRTIHSTYIGDILLPPCVTGCPISSTTTSTCS